MRRPFHWLVCGAIGAVATGCASASKAPAASDQAALRQRAVEAVKWAVRYEHAAAIRVLGIEVMEKRFGPRGLPWIRNALRDDSPGVQFAALLALGTVRDRESYATIRTFAGSDDPELRVGAYYALHRLGDTSRSAQLPQMLLEHESPGVRRDVALVLGLMGEPNAIKLLARAMKDEDEQLRLRALTSMALLGGQEAIQQLTFEASSGMGNNRVAAIMGLSELRSPELAGTFRYKLESGEFIETRLAAARALGLLNSGEGYSLALREVDFNSPRTGPGHDPPQEQISRVRQIAVLALGAIGNPAALPALERRLNDQSDPVLQIVTADAILEMLGVDAPFDPPRAAFRGNRRGE